MAREKRRLAKWITKNRLTSREIQSLWETWAACKDPQRKEKIKRRILDAMAPYFMRIIARYAAEEPEELFSEAWLAAYHAFEKYNPKRSQLITYLCYRVNWHLKTYLTIDRTLVKVPSWARVKVRRMTKMGKYNPSYDVAWQVLFGEDPSIFPVEQLAEAHHPKLPFEQLESLAWGQLLDRIKSILSDEEYQELLTSLEDGIPIPQRIVNKIKEHPEIMEVVREYYGIEEKTC